MFWNPLLWSSSILFPNPHLSLSRWATDFISTAPTQQRIYHAQQTLVKGFCASLQKNRKTSLKSAFAPPDTHQRPIHLFDLVSMRQYPLGRYSAGQIIWRPEEGVENVEGVEKLGKWYWPILDAVLPFRQWGRLSSCFLPDGGSCLPCYSSSVSSSCTTKTVSKRR
jgi:hypothetical protein